MDYFFYRGCEGLGTHGKVVFETFAQHVQDGTMKVNIYLEEPEAFGKF